MDCFDACRGSQTPRSPSTPHQTGSEDVAFGPSDGLGTPVESGFVAQSPRPTPAACQRFTSLRESEVNQRWLWQLDADSCGKTVSCPRSPPQFIPVTGPPPPGQAAAERGMAPQDGSDRIRLGSRKRIRAAAWSARPPFASYASRIRSEPEVAVDQLDADSCGKPSLASRRLPGSFL